MARINLRVNGRAQTRTWLPESFATGGARGGAGGGLRRGRDPAWRTADGRPVDRLTCRAEEVLGTLQPVHVVTARAVAPLERDYTDARITHIMTRLQVDGDWQIVPPHSRYARRGSTTTRRITQPLSSIKKSSTRPSLPSVASRRWPRTASALPPRVAPTGCATRCFGRSSAPAPTSSSCRSRTSSGGAIASTCPAPSAAGKRRRPTRCVAPLRACSSCSRRLPRAARVPRSPSTS